MTTVKAILIAKNIMSEDYCPAEKIAAIIKVRDMPTINSISKDELRTVIRYLIGRLSMFHVLAAESYLKDQEDLPYE